MVEMGEVPENWKTSRTVLIPKKSKLLVEDFRPVALTNDYYKLAMSFRKERIYDYMSRYMKMIYKQSLVREEGWKIIYLW